MRDDAEEKGECGDACGNGMNNKSVGEPFDEAARRGEARRGVSGRVLGLDGFTASYVRVGNGDLGGVAKYLVSIQLVAKLGTLACRGCPNAFDTVAENAELDGAIER